MPNRLNLAYFPKRPVVLVAPRLESRRIAFLQKYCQEKLESAKKAKKHLFYGKIFMMISIVFCCFLTKTAVYY